MSRAAKTLCFTLLLIIAYFPAAAFEKAIVACSPEKPVVFPGESLLLRVWTVADAPETLSVEWETRAGKLSKEEGIEVRWDLSGLQPGPYTATARVILPTGGTEVCSVKVLVVTPEGRGRVTGSALLLAGMKEKSGYGLYSYLLFGSRPIASTRERYTKAIEAYLALMESIMELEKAGVSPHRLNVTYLPVRKRPATQRLSAEWILDNYDFARARALLNTVPGEYRTEGPYIVSHLSPLSRVTRLPEKYLFQDISRIEPKVVYGYVKEFLNQAAQERYWDARTVNGLFLKLQDIIYISASAFPEVVKSRNDIRSKVRLIE